SKSFASWRAARSSTESPIATPTRAGSLVPARRKTPNGRFWMGKSLRGSFALSTHERRSGEVVGSFAGKAVLMRGGYGQTPPASHGDVEQPEGAQVVDGLVDRARADREEQPLARAF